MGLFVAQSSSELRKPHEALRIWSAGKCLENQGQRQLENRIQLQVLSSSALSSSRTNNATSSNSKSTLNNRSDSIKARGECRTITVADGDGCGSLASKCGINGHDFEGYNSKKPQFCSSLVKGQLVCCSEGTLPSRRPSPGSDGGCYAHQVGTGETCAGLAASFDITEDELFKWNKHVWGWQGCGNKLQRLQIICLSDGNPPMPAQLDGVMCGPQKPGTAKPNGKFTGEDLSKLNPCSLNACCDSWGFCGTTAEFCTVSPADTGSPGTHQDGTNSCISNCGMDIVQSPSAPKSFYSIGYFEGYGLTRACDLVDIRSIDVTRYTHIHFAFATISADTYDVNMGPTINQFYYFKKVTGVKKVLSFGGWTFSTE